MYDSVINLPPSYITTLVRSVIFSISFRLLLHRIIVSLNQLKKSNKQNWNKLEQIIISFKCSRLLMMFSLLLLFVVVVAIGFVNCSSNAVIVNNKKRGLRIEDNEVISILAAQLLVQVKSRPLDFMTTLSNENWKCSVFRALPICCFQTNCVYIVKVQKKIIFLLISKRLHFWR